MVHAEDQTEEVTLLAEVCTTSILSDCGEIFILGAHVFYQLFCHMEECSLLDPSNEVHIFALHFVCLPRINRHLRIFSSGHNNGPISTERNMTPVQLWVNGLMQIQGSNHRVVQELRQRADIEDYGIDWEGPAPSEAWNGPLCRLFCRVSSHTTDLTAIFFGDMWNWLEQ